MLTRQPLRRHRRTDSIKNGTDETPWSSAQSSIVVHSAPPITFLEQTGFLGCTPFVPRIVPSLGVCASSVELVAVASRTIFVSLFCTLSC